MDGARLGFLFSNDEDKPLPKTGQLCVGVRRRLIKKLNGYLENWNKISIFAKKVIDKFNQKKDNKGPRDMSNPPLCGTGQGKHRE